MSEFQKGEKVQLKSGGPTLVVADTGDYRPMGPENGVKCNWFSGNDKREDVFEAATLERVPEMGPISYPD